MVESTATTTTTTTTTTTSRYFDIEEGSPDYLFGKLYERQPVTNLWNVLTGIVEKQWRLREYNRRVFPPAWRLAHVFGPPGTGKSSAVWHWAASTMAAKIRNDSASPEEAAALVPFVGWVSCGSAEVFSIVLSSKNNGTSETIVAAPSTLEHVTEQSSWPKKSILVFDGILDSNKEKWIINIILAARAGVAVVLVSSEGVRLNEGTFQGITIIDHRVPGWTEEEYDLACENEEFFRAVAPVAFGSNAAYPDRSELISDKLFLAGHSARWMFQRRPSQVKSLIKKALDSVHPNLSDLQDYLSRTQCYGAVNSLISWLHESNGPTPLQSAQVPSTHLLLAADHDVFFPDATDEGGQQEKEISETSNNCFVSVWAAQQMIARVQAPSGLLRGMGHQIGEMAVVGYAFQKRFLELALHSRLTQRPLQVNVGRTLEDWPVQEIFYGNPLRRLQSAGDVPENLFVWAVGYTAAYDAILFCGHGVLRFIQVTAGVKHSLKLLYAVQLLNELRNRGIFFTHIDFVVVRPDDDARKFALESPIGSFHGWKTVNDIDWGSGGRAKKQVKLGTVAWS